MKRWIWLALGALTVGAAMWLLLRSASSPAPTARWYPERFVARSDGSALVIETLGKQRRLSRLEARADAAPQTLTPLSDGARLLAGSSGPVLVADGPEVHAVDAGWSTTLSAPACAAAWADAALTVVGACGGDDVRVLGLSSRDGAVQWSVPLPGAGPLLEVAATPGVVALRSHRGGVTVLDRTGGRVLWQARGPFCVAGSAVLVASGERGESWLHRVSSAGIETVARAAPRASRRRLIDCAPFGDRAMILVHEDIPAEALALYVGEDRTVVGMPAPARDGAGQARLTAPQGPFMPLADGRGTIAVVELATGRAVAQATRSGAGAMAWSFGQLLLFPGLVARVDPSDGSIVAAVTLPAGGHPQVAGGRIWVRTGRGMGALDSETLAPLRWDGPAAGPKDAQVLAEALVWRRPPPQAVADVGLPVRLLAFTPDGDLVIGQGHTRPLRVLARDTLPEQQARARAAGLPVFRFLSTAASPDGAHVVVLGDRGPTGNALGRDDQARLLLWKTHGQEPPHTLARFPAGEVVHIGVNDRCVGADLRDGRRVAWSLESAARLPQGHDCRAATSLHPARRGVAVSAFPPLAGPEERLVATLADGSPGATLAGGGLVVRGQTWIAPGHEGDVVFARFSPNGDRLAGYDHAARAVRVWDAAGRELARYEAWLTVTALAFDEAGRLLAIGDEAGVVRVVSVDDAPDAQ